VLRQYREKLALEGKIAGVESLVEMQREYYPVILDSIEAARRARHDLHHHVHVMHGLVSSGKYSELEIYLRQYSSGFFDMSPLTYCENDIVDVILRHFAVLAMKVSVCFNVDVDVPEAISVENADLCTVLGNLLENALEACAYVKSDKKINIIIKQIGNELVILVDNTFDGNVTSGSGTSGSGTFISRKRRKREGVGLASVRAVAERYGGSAEFYPDVSNRVFHSEVVLGTVQ
jgi:sensor histidine kinase regulating citrate/malate metabolism